MTWNCCTPTGECQQGPGCPAGRKDTCPGQPGAQAARVARVGKQHSRQDALRNVMLDAGQAPKTPGVLQSMLRRVLQLVGAAAVLAIWLLACAATDDHKPEPCQRGQGQCTHWEGQA